MRVEREGERVERESGRSGAKVINGRVTMFLKHCCCCRRKKMLHCLHRTFEKSLAG